MAVYLLNNSDEPEFNFITCSVPIDSPWFYLCWSLGRAFEEAIPEPIQYYADKSGEPQDFPVVNADQFLVSEKVLKIIKSSGSKFDAYKSEIILPQAKSLKNYYTLNFTESIAALDWEKSIYDRDQDFPSLKVRNTQKIVLKIQSVPKGSYIFRLAENESHLLVTEEFKDQIGHQNLTGFKFIEVELS